MPKSLEVPLKIIQETIKKLKTIGFENIKMQITMPGKSFCLYSDKAIQIKLRELENIKTKIRNKLGYNGIPRQSVFDQTKFLTSSGNKIKLTLKYKKQGKQRTLLLSKFNEKQSLKCTYGDLIDAGIDFTLKCSNPKGTPMVYACETNEKKLIRALIEKHDVEKTGFIENMIRKEGKGSDNTIYTPLQMAVKKKNKDIVEYLINTCDPIDLIGQKNSNNWNSLHYAAENNNSQMLQFLIHNYNGNIQDIINQKDKSGQTPLDMAYWHNKSNNKDAIVALLRKYGGKANYYDKDGNEVGEGKGDLNIINIARENGDLEKGEYTFIINQKDKDGKTPLDVAYSENLSTIITWLRQHGGKANYYDTRGQFVGENKGDLNDLRIACKNGDLEKMENFLEQNEYKYLIGDADTYGNTCLHYAATKKDKNFAQVLINNYEGKIKKIINKKNKFGNTPLDVAYSKKSSEVVTLLRRKGGKANRYDTNGKKVGQGKGDLNDFYDIAYKNVTLINNKYQKAFPKGTPLVCACEKGDLNDVRVLIEAHNVEETGMSVEEMVSKEGKDSGGGSITPLQTALYNEQLEIVQYLVKRFPAKDLIGQTNNKGLNSLHYAARYKDDKMLQFLINNYKGNKIIINMEDNRNRTPLDFAYLNKNTDAIEYLKSIGATANKFDKYGKYKNLYDNIKIKF